MEIYTVLALTLLLLLLGSGRLFFQRKRFSSMPSADYNPITAEQVEQEFVQLHRALERQPRRKALPLHYGYPDAHQWLILLQQSPQEAADLLTALRRQLMILGRSAEVVTISSLIAYEAAHKYLQVSGPLPEDQISKLTTAATYIDQQAWHQLLAEDRHEAIQLLSQLELQRAQFGIAAPPTIEASIAAFHRAARATAKQPENVATDSEQ